MRVCNTIMHYIIYRLRKFEHKFVTFKTAWIQSKEQIIFLHTQTNIPDNIAKQLLL